MNIFTSVIVYLLVFWTVLFTVLPWGNKPKDWAKEAPEAGMAGSAPVNPRIKQKFLITFAISSVIWVIIAALIHFEVVDFYAISREMMKEDALL